jgi:16S rRNA (uracil1498-N3)-methyltransferase
LRPEPANDASPAFVLLEAIGAPGEEVTLPKEAAHYVTRVCRARAGERFSATDGHGVRARLRLLEVAREVRARIENAEHVARTREATLWCGAPEGERADWLIEKLAELGVTRFQPLDTERATWRPGAARADRWRRLAAAALRQSRQCWLMEILPPRSLVELSVSPITPASRWLADPDGTRAPAAPLEGQALGAIGPASGWTDAERGAFASQGFRAISLASGRLRTETAALSWAAWWAGAG